ncbi:MAG: gfo/Idh/MocA family oxidoreductase [Phycisphaera sp.]|nr:gfo/Idh/MocA family oxidoreductase [Phycisphaera sp.]
MSQASPNKVRLAIVGCGNMGSSHVENITKNIETATIAAVCDTNPEKLQQAVEKSNGSAKPFSNHHDLLKSDACEAVIVATPHYGHTTIGIDAFKAGKHVLVEKPISVHKADCERLIAAHTDKKLVFAAMFNQRTDPHYKTLKKMLDAGELGELVRVSWIITNWFRTQNYYDGGGWRATWAGEGGGVLSNQCPHQLDLMQWLFGMPTKVMAFCGLGIRHNIEVEDQVTAYLEYANGATGTFITSTGEAPGTNRLEVVGEMGKVVIERGKFTFTRNEMSAIEFLKTSDKAFASPKTEVVDIPIDGNGGQHREVLANYVDAIRNGTPLIAPAAEGIHSVELGNAMVYSSMTGKPVVMPLDAAAYEKKLKELIANSTFVKKAAPVAAGVTDLSGSF